MKLKRFFPLAMKCGFCAFRFSDFQQNVKLFILSLISSGCYNFFTATDHNAQTTKEESVVTSKGVTNPKRPMTMQERDGKKLFWMALPFMIFIFVFSYMPLWGWSFAFFQYKPQTNGQKAPTTGN